MSLLITKAQRERLLENGRRTAEGIDHDPKPVVKLFTPFANATWLLTELDVEIPDLAFGLCDLGMGFPELGNVMLSEIASLRGPAGLRVERDRHWRPDGTLSQYADAAHAAGRIVDYVKGGGR